MSPKLSRIFSLLFLALFLTACSSDSGGSNEVTNAAKNAAKNNSGDGDNTGGNDLTNFVGSNTANISAFPNAPITVTGVTESSITVLPADGTVTLKGLAVSLNDVTTHQRYNADSSWTDDASELKIARQVTPNRLIDAGVDMTFVSGSGSATTIYADANYTASNTDAITVDRSTIFGFNSNYMAYISWGKDESLDTDNVALTQTVTNIDGMMIAGIETGTIIAAGRVDFTGKGVGTYGTKTTRYSTAFDVNVAVNFGNSLDITTDNTACTGGCSGVTVPSYLDFTTGAISYTGNNISKALTLGSTLTGRLDARFYGGNTQEFGGTFALAEASTGSIDGQYYYGAFGASRNGVAPFVGSKAVAIAALTDTNPTMPGLAVSINNTTHYTRADGLTSAWNITDEDYLQIASTNTLSRITDAGDAPTITDVDGTIGGLTASFGGVSITPDRAFFGFDSDYMAYISWGATQTATDLGNNATTGTLINIDGMMITGIETGTILSSGRVDFTGKGAGVYGTKTTGYSTAFDVTAAVDFDENDVIISSSNTACTSDCNGVTVPSYLDFTTGAISYTGNNISQALTLDSSLTGTLDARFYGGNTEEFGGTFALAQADTRYYYGAFGANRHGVAPFVGSDTTTLNALDSSAATNPQATNIGAHSSLATVSNSTVTLQGLTVGLKDATEYTRYQDDLWNVNASELQIDRQITPTRITSSAVALTFG
ncbi:MAG: hypothetical protein K0U39_03315, partial [Alphaproteobacteria bacterium]|nr:hypothetical protein [Alphaproteobacteria bacterium]